MLAVGTYSKAYASKPCLATQHIKGSSTEQYNFRRNVLVLNISTWEVFREIQVQSNLNTSLASTQQGARTGSFITIQYNLSDIIDSVEW